jgi:hypothetical protein
MGVAGWLPCRVNLEDEEMEYPRFTLIFDDKHSNQDDGTHIHTTHMNTNRSTKIGGGSSDDTSLPDLRISRLALNKVVPGVMMLKFVTVVLRGVGTRLLT